VVLWGCRVGLAALSAAVLLLHWFTWKRLIAALAIGAGLAVIHELARRGARGSFIDENGERQLIEGNSRGRVIYTPTRWGTRLVEEETLRKRRRIQLFWTTPPLALMTWGAVVLYGPRTMVFSLLLDVVALGCGITWWIKPFATELLYQTGYQHMRGAKVLDPEPVRPGVEQVVRQKAHGRASVAGESEAIDMLGGREG